MPGVGVSTARVRIGFEGSRRRNRLITGTPSKARPRPVGRCRYAAPPSKLAGGPVESLGNVDGFGVISRPGGGDAVQNGGSGRKLKGKLGDGLRQLGWIAEGLVNPGEEIAMNEQIHT